MVWGWGAGDPCPCPSAVARADAGPSGLWAMGGGKVSFTLMDGVPEVPPLSSSHWTGVVPVPAPSQGCWVSTSPREHQVFTESL